MLRVTNESCGDRKTCGEPPNICVQRRRRAEGDPLYISARYAWAATTPTEY